MSEVRVTKRKVDDLEPTAEGEADPKKRAKNVDEVVVEEVDVGSDEDSEDDLENELKDLEKEAPVLQRRTRGVRVDYTQLKGGDDEEDDEEDEDDEQEEEANGGEIKENGNENGLAEEGNEDEASEEEAGEERNGDEDNEE